MNASIQKCFRGGEKPVKTGYSIQEYGHANSEIKGLKVHERNKCTGGAIGQCKHDKWRYPQIKTGTYVEYRIQSYRRLGCRMVGLTG